MHPSNAETERVATEIQMPFPSFQNSPSSRCPLCLSAREILVSGGNLRSLKKCSSCGLHYVDPCPSTEEILSYFSGPEEMRTERLDIRKQVRQRNLFRIAQYVKRQKTGGRILDVGCGVGHFLGTFFQGPEWRRWGVELSRYLIARATEKSIETRQGDLVTAEFQSEFFDVITVLDTFYYFADPRRQLNEIRRILEPSGLLVMEFPLAQCHLFRTGRFGQLLTRGSRDLGGVDHFFCAPKPIRLALQTSGFRIDNILPLPGNDPNNAFEQSLYRAYSAISSLVWWASSKRLMMGPRFLVSASPA